MADIWISILQQFREYFAVSLYPLLFFVCLLLIWFLPSAKQERDSLVVPNLLFAAVTFFPPCAYLIMKMLGDNTVYWRMFWMLTIPLVCGYAIVKVTSEFSKRAMQILAGFIAAAIILMSGRFIFTGDYFTKSDNIYKIPTEAIEVADLISDSAKEEGIEDPKAAVPAYISTYIRQYDAGIRLAYGRNMVKGDVDWSKLFNEINSETPRAKRLARLARKADCDYLVLPADVSLHGNLSKYSFTLVDEAGGYAVYLDEEQPEG